MMTPLVYPLRETQQEIFFDGTLYGEDGLYSGGSETITVEWVDYDNLNGTRFQMIIGRNSSGKSYETTRLSFFW